MHILFVCTGNVCRSPLAARLAHAWATAAMGRDSSRVEIRSAGLSAPVGRPMDPHSAAALTRLGGDPSSAQARAFTPAMAQEADLVLTMTRRQRSQALQLFPRGMRRTFTLREAADLLASTDLRGLDLVPQQDRARELAERLHAARTRRTTPGADDIEDPIGRSPSVHERVADEIAAALRPLVDVLWPARASTTPHGSPRADGGQPPRGGQGRRKTAEAPRAR